MRAHETCENRVGRFRQIDRRFRLRVHERQGHGRAQAYFNPEFLNRVDDTIVFNPLGKEEIAKIVDIQLQEVSGKLSERNVSLE